MTALMRPFLFALQVLAACQSPVPAPDAVTPGQPAGLATAVIETTKLDGAPVVAAVTAKPGTAAVAATSATDAVTVQVPGKTTLRPKARPADLKPAAKVVKPQETPVPNAPIVPKPPEQLVCEKSGGTWAAVGNSNANFCEHRTRDGGKQCTRKTQCEGDCLARSGTCSPITPLFGCNAVLEADGRRVTLCLQ